MIKSADLVLWKLQRIVHFLAHSSSRYSIHSPFLYEITDRVIRGRGHWFYDPGIENLRKAMLGSGEVIMKTDYGAGGDRAGEEYPVRTGRLAGTSLTSRRHARRLFRLVSHLQPATILEIGTSLGVTAAYLASASPAAKVVSLEGCPNLSRIARENLRSLGLTNVEIVTGPFSATLPEALQKLGSAEMVYFDGNHRYEPTLEYFRQCLRYSGNNTVMVFDDIHANPEMEQAWLEICSHDELRVTIDLFFSGWVFFRTESSREHFRLRYF